MTVPIRIEIRGLKETQAKMEQVVKDLHGAPMVQGMRDATLYVTADAKRLAPVDTGRLRASITPQVVTQGDTILGIVGSNVLYAPYMELGTGVFAGNKPHWPPAAALEVWARRHGFESGFVVARAIGRRGGLRPRKYLEQAFTKNAARIHKLIGDVVGRIVAR